MGCIFKGCKQPTASDRTPYCEEHRLPYNEKLDAVGRKDDAGKDRWSLMPDEIDDVVRVLMHGAGIYGDHNWKLVKDAQTRYYDAIMRHIRAWKRGEVLDPESGLPHLAHVACNALFLAHFDKEH